ncbi:MAG: hypothetical protein ACRDMX_04830 [Solirubrobacteraceae bacterium]
MSATGTDKERLLELDADEREAWSAYIDRLRRLEGDEYELAESECWEELQQQLRRVEQERDELAAGAHR